MEHLQEISNVETARSPKKRDSNLELFRIITMMFIVAHHYVINSGLIGIDGLVFLKKNMYARNVGLRRCFMFTKN